MLTIDQIIEIDGLQRSRERIVKHLEELISVKQRRSKALKELHNYYEAQKVDGEINGINITLNLLK